MWGVFFLYIKFFGNFYFSVLAGEDGGLCTCVFCVCVCVCVGFFWKGAKRN